MKAFCICFYNMQLFTIVDPANAESLYSIETSILILCLDKSIPINMNHRRSVDETDHRQRDDNSLALQMLHGQGTQLNSLNRWYDKTMQVGGRGVISI